QVILFQMRSTQTNLIFGVYLIILAVCGIFVTDSTEIFFGRATDLLTLKRLPPFHSEGMQLTFAIALALGFVHFFIGYDGNTQASQRTVLTRLIFAAMIFYLIQIGKIEKLQIMLNAIGRISSAFYLFVVQDVLTALWTWSCGSSPNKSKSR